MKTVRMLINGAETGLGNKFKAQVIERRPGHPDEGKVVFETPYGSNLILDNGMDRIAEKLICGLFEYCAVGYSADPVLYDSGAVTATTSGTTCTTSGAFFVGGHEGALLRFDTGEKSKIVSVTNGTEAILEDTLDVGSGTEFTLHYVEQTGLVDEVVAPDKAVRNNNYLVGSPNCGTTLTGGRFIHTRTFDFAIEVESKSYYEVGFSHSATAGENLNTRGIFTGAPVMLIAGQQLRVVYHFIVDVTPYQPRDSEVAVSGWPAKEYDVAVDAGGDFFSHTAHGLQNGAKVFFNGTVEPGGITFDTPYYVVNRTDDTLQVEASIGGGVVPISSSGTDVVMFTNTVGEERLYAAAYSQVSSTTGATVSGTSNASEPFSSKWMFLTENYSELGAWPVAAGSIPTWTAPTGGKRALDTESYVAGSFEAFFSTTFPTTEGNSELIRRFVINGGNGPLGDPIVPHGLIYTFDYPQSKGNAYRLYVRWKYSWDRNFVG